MEINKMFEIIKEEKVKYQDVNIECDKLIFNDYLTRGIGSKLTYKSNIVAMCFNNLTKIRDIIGEAEEMQDVYAIMFKNRLNELNKAKLDLEGLMSISKSIIEYNMKWQG